MQARTVLCLTLIALGTAIATAQTPGPAVNKAGTQAAKPAVSATSGWKELSSDQRAALAPLATQWDSLSDIQKRKWQALSRNFASMSPTEQATLRSRMTEWASLSAKQRSVARLNFEQTRQLPPDEKKAKWEAYQALSAEEKRKLATSSHKATSAALAIKPVPRQKLAQVPKGKPTARNPPAEAAVPARPVIVPAPTEAPAPSPMPAPAAIPAPAPTPVPAPSPFATDRQL